MEELRGYGDIAVECVKDMILTCATERLNPEDWWDSAKILCKEVIGVVKSNVAKTSLFEMLETSSRIWEFNDQVKTHAAMCLVSICTRDDLPRLKVLLDRKEQLTLQPNAIHYLVEAINKFDPSNATELTELPELVMSKGRQMEDSKEAIVYFYGCLNKITKWSVNHKGGFYYFLGRRVEHLLGHAAALPFYAASLTIKPSEINASWLSFPGMLPSLDNARKLSEKYPLPLPDLQVLLEPSEQRTAVSSTAQEEEQKDTGGINSMSAVGSGAEFFQEVPEQKSNKIKEDSYARDRLSSHIEYPDSKELTQMSFFSPPPLNPEVLKMRLAFIPGNFNGDYKIQYNGVTYKVCKKVDLEGDEVCTEACTIALCFPLLLSIALIDAVTCGWFGCFSGWDKYEVDKDALRAIIGAITTQHNNVVIDESRWKVGLESCLNRMQSRHCGRVSGIELSKIFWESVNIDQEAANTSVPQVAMASLGRAQ